MKKPLIIKKPAYVSESPAKGFTPSYVIDFPRYLKVIPLSMKQFKTIKKGYKGANRYKRTGAFIRELRIQRGLSIKELAAGASMKPSFISNIENGSRQFTLHSLDKIAKALKQKVKSLLEPGTINDNLTDREFLAGLKPRVWKLMFVRIKK